MNIGHQGSRETKKNATGKDITSLKATTRGRRRPEHGVNLSESCTRNAQGIEECSKEVS